MVFPDEFFLLKKKGPGEQHPEWLRLLLPAGWALRLVEQLEGSNVDNVLRSSLSALLAKHL